MDTSKPLAERTEASAVPQAPPPITAARMPDLRECRSSNIIPRVSEHARPLEIGFAPWMIAGVRTQWDNMVPHVMARPDIHPHVVEITPYKAGALWERLPLIPASVKGNVRSMLSGGGLIRGPRPHVVWAQGMRSLPPHLATRARWQRTPVGFTNEPTPLA